MAICAVCAGGGRSKRVVGPVPTFTVRGHLAAVWSRRFFQAISLTVLVLLKAAVSLARSHVFTGGVSYFIAYYAASSGIRLPL